MFKKFLNGLLGNDDEQPKESNNPVKAQANQQYNEEMNDGDDDDDDDDYEDDDEFNEGSEDPVTHHGTHYTQAQFDAEVERLVNNWKAEEPEASEKDIRNVRLNLARDVFREWNPYADESQQLRFHQKYSNDAFGFATFGSTQHDENNPLLQPIHGVSLHDYSAAAAKLANGVSEEAICKALGIETPVWQEANTLWVKRMQEDSSFTVTGLFGQYFGEAGNHPKLGTLAGAPLSAEAQSNLDRLTNDRYFYEELCGARQAAYEYGLDGAQWIVDNFGVSLGDFQGVATKWMLEQNREMDSTKILHFHNYQQEKQKEYAAKFAAEQGGNVADDVEF